MKKILMSSILFASLFGTANAQFYTHNYSGKPATLVQNGNIVSSKNPVSVTFTSGSATQNYGGYSGAPISLVQSGNFVSQLNPLAISLVGSLPSFTSYTKSTLPSSSTAGQMAFCSDCTQTTSTSVTLTGSMVFYNGTQWIELVSIPVQ